MLINAGVTARDRGLKRGNPGVSCGSRRDHFGKKTDTEWQPEYRQTVPTTILAKRFAHYQKVNPALLELFYQHQDRGQRGAQQSYASKDDLLSQYPLHKELNELAEFISQGIVEVASEESADLWRGRPRHRLLSCAGIQFQRKPKLQLRFQ